MTWWSGPHIICCIVYGNIWVGVAQFVWSVRSRTWYRFTSWPIQLPSFKCHCSRVLLVHTDCRKEYTGVWWIRQYSINIQEMKRAKSQLRQDYIIHYIPWWEKNIKVTDFCRSWYQTVPICNAALSAMWGGSNRMRSWRQMHRLHIHHTVRTALTWPEIVGGWKIQKINIENHWSCKGRELNKIMERGKVKFFLREWPNLIDIELTVKFQCHSTVIPAYIICTDPREQEPGDTINRVHIIKLMVIILSFVFLLWAVGEFY